jgi:acetyltransferase-like isoleucine patch superfamily enzyme
LNCRRGEAKRHNTLFQTETAGTGHVPDRAQTRGLIEKLANALIVPHKKDENVITEMKRLRCSFKIQLNYLLIQIAKILFYTRAKHFIYRHCLGIKLGKNVGFGIIELDPIFPELITIGDNTTIGLGATIFTHEYTQTKTRLGKVTIGNNVLIGSFSLIRSGVTIGDNSVVSMYSLVNKDVPPNELWGGVPAKRIKKLKAPI